MPRPDAATVVIVGAGPAGLGVAGALAERGIAARVLERDHAIGARWRGRYDRLRLHTVRSFSGLPGEPIPRRCTRYVAKDDYADYLERYVRRLRLDVRLGIDVRQVSANGDGWWLEANEASLRSASVVVATGRYDRPWMPDWPGRSTFRGVLQHAAEFRRGWDLRGQRVLVVGLGNSGAEIAAELTEHAASVAVSVRTTPPIARRQVGGVPLQLLGIALAPLPAGPVDGVGALLRRMSVGDLGAYGLGRAAWGPFAARRPPVIDAGFLTALRAGRLRVVPAVVAVTEDGVVLENGVEERFDAIVAATGYRTSLDDLVDVPGVLTADGVPRSTRPREGLYFVGFRDSVRGQLFEASREARRVAADLAHR
jgi:putative flavoprotein involved in K+ transport